MSMQVDRAIRPNLLFGKFYGTSNITRHFAGFSASLMVPEVPEREMPKHSHEDASFVIVLRGVYLSSADGAAGVVSDSAIIYNPPGTTHRDRFRDLEGAQFLGISISDKNLNHASEAVRLPDRPTCYKHGEAVLTARKIARQCRQWPDGARLLTEALCWELLAHVGRAKKTDSRKAPAWLQELRMMIRENCNARIRVADAAAFASVHPVYLVRRFRECFGCTPGDYMRKCRVERAASLVGDVKSSLAEIAAAAGYADQSQMSKAFQWRFRMTPREYRRLVTGKTFECDK